MSLIHVAHPIALAFETWISHLPVSNSLSFNFDMETGRYDSPKTQTVFETFQAGAGATSAWNAQFIEDRQDVGRPLRSLKSNRRVRLCRFMPAIPAMHEKEVDTRRPMAHTLTP